MDYGNAAIDKIYAINRLVKTHDSQPQLSTTTRVDQHLLASPVNSKFLANKYIQSSTTEPFDTTGDR